MHVLAWILSGVLGGLFLIAGALKTFVPFGELRNRPGMEWTASFTASQVKAIAVLEILGAIGIIVPWAVDVARVLTPIAAVGLVVIMMGAAVTHARRREWPQVGANALLLVLAAVVAIIRFSQL